MSRGPTKTSPASPQLLRVVVCAGYFPGMRQPALSANFALSRNEREDLGAEQAGRIATTIATFIPNFSLRELPGAGSAYPLLALVAGVYEALLHKAGIPLLCPSRLASMDRSEKTATVYLPLLDHGIYPPYVEALQWASRLVKVLQAGGDVNTLSSTLSRVLQQLSEVAPSGMNSRLFIEEADRLGIPWRKVTGNIYRFGFASRARLFDSSFTDRTSHIGARLARDKRLTAQVLNASGLPGARHEQALDEDGAVRIAERMGYPVVVKPANADGGHGVMPGLTNAGMVRKAFGHALAVSSQVLVEKHFEGKDYRVQILHDEVYWISERVPGGVTGDGERSVEELLKELNADPRRGPRSSNSRLKFVDLDEETLEMLAKVGLDRHAVPSAGQFVRLRRAANVASGGIPVPALEGAHRDNIELAVRASRLLRLDVSGIDLIIPDIRESWLESGALICEINAQPQLSSLLPAHLLKNLLADNGRVPVTVVLGGEPAWIMSAEKLLNDAGCRVGMLRSDGVYVRGRRALKTPASAFLGCEALFNDTAVDHVIICLDDDQFLTTGFPIDRFDRLVLAKPETIPDASAWQTLHDCAALLAELCQGEILLEKQGSGWQPVLDKLPGDKLRIVDAEELLCDPVPFLSKDIN